MDEYLNQYLSPPRYLPHDSSYLEDNKDFLVGINLFYQQKAQYSAPKAKIFTRFGSMKLLDYGEQQQDNIILIIPSLINKYYILDLMSDCSLINFLVKQGYRVFVIAWENPLPDEYTFNINNYVLDRIVPVIQLLHRLFETKIHLLGYCLGGTLAIMAAFSQAKFLHSMILLATPWNFTALQHLNFFDHQLQDYSLPISAASIKYYFWLLYKDTIMQKFINFAHTQHDLDEKMLFIAVESWLDDGLALTQQVALDITQLIKGHPILLGDYQVGGNLSHITLPTFIVIPQKDKIVSPSASIILQQLTNHNLLAIQTGHIGMIISPTHKYTCWQAIDSWCNNFSDPSNQ